VHTFGGKQNGNQGPGPQPQVDARRREHTPSGIEGKSFDSTGSMRRTPKLSQKLKMGHRNSKERVIEVRVN
jgi:hypothetical protein